MYQYYQCVNVSTDTDTDINISAPLYYWLLLYYT